MMYSNSYLQDLFEGYLKTSLLWDSNPFNELNQLKIYSDKVRPFNRKINKQLRLGMLAEQFVFHELTQMNSCTILFENLQIQKDSITLGELDALIEINSEIIHLEIIYKFYLYDSNLGDSEIERWIGPNRNDSLNEKIHKLKNKQLPLLYSPYCQSALKQYNVKEEAIKQNVLFKAQLFTPYNANVDFIELNQECVSGCYITLNQLDNFNNCTFYIPPKLDWLLMPNINVNWIDFNQLLEDANEFLKQKKSPLIWIKTPNNKLMKCFIVWW